LISSSITPTTKLKITRQYFHLRGQAP